MSSNPTSSQADCPSTKQLQDWLNSDLEFPVELQQHLKLCERCATLLATLSDDRELQSLASTSLLNPDRNHHHEPEFLELQQKLNLWPMNDFTDSQHNPPSADEVSSAPFSTERADLAETDRELSILDMPSLESIRNRLPAKMFSVDRLIAKGGSGAVYLAYDQQLKREVAIKVLGRNSSRDRQRFLREARILAELEHSNIVRVFDFGKLDSAIDSDSGADPANTIEHLFLVMEYVPGGTAGNLRVDQPCWQNSNALGRMSYRRLAKLLATAADGLAAAHAKGLVHRDVKPGNLMLTLDWSSIKVADFGLAKLAEVDNTQVTRTGDLLGTPVFMSPEQVTGQNDLSAASDIYSLGATLYQLLTGEAPFQGNSAAILRQIAEAPPVAPRLLNPIVPAELEVICLHAMEKEPGSRYASMSQFADDLRRFSEGEPIHARPASASAKAIRFLKKNRPFAMALAAATLLVLALTAGSITAAVVFRTQNHRLTESAKAESIAKVAAQESLRKSIEAADELLVSVTEDTELLPRTPGSEEIARKLLRKAQEYYRQVIASGGNSQLVLFDEARARSGLAQVSLRLGNPSDVETEAEAAIALLESLPIDAIPSSERAALIAKTLGYLGKSLATQGELRRSSKVMTDAVDVCQVELDKIASSPGTKPDDSEKTELRFLLADSLRGRAVAENMAGNIDGALSSLNRAIEIFNELLELEPDQPKYLRKAAGCESTLAVTLVRRDGYEVAKQHLEQAISILSKLEQDGDLPIRIRPDRATNVVNLASMEYYLGNHDRAAELFTQAQQEYEQLSLLEPGVVDHKYKVVLTVLNSGKVSVATGKIESILERYRLLLPILDELLTVDPDSQEYLGTLGMVQGNIAALLRMLKRPEEALDTLQVSDKTLRQYALLIENTPDSLYAVALNQYELSKCYLELARFPEGIEAIKAGMVITSAVLAEHPEYLPSRMHKVDELIALCDLLESQPNGDIEVLKSTAERAFEESKSLLSEFTDLVDSQIAHGSLFAILSEVERRQQHFEKAAELAEEGIRFLQTIDSDLDAQNMRERFLDNYLALAKAQADQWKKLGDESQQEKIELGIRLGDSLKKCRDFGATETLVSELYKLLEAS